MRNPRLVDGPFMRRFPEYPSAGRSREEFRLLHLVTPHLGRVDLESQARPGGHGEETGSVQL